MWGELPTKLLLDADRVRLESEGRPVMIRHRGEPDRGVVLAVINRLDGTCAVWGQTRDLDGKLGWYQPKGDSPLPEADCEQLIARSIARDPDVWVVELEDRAGQLRLTT